MSATKPEARGSREGELGAQFRRVRRARKWSLERLAKALDCTINTIRWHEGGARMLRTDLLTKAAEVMGTTVGELTATAASKPPVVETGHGRGGAIQQQRRTAA